MYTLYLDLLHDFLRFLQTSVLQRSSLESDTLYSTARYASSHATGGVIAGERDWIRIVAFFPSRRGDHRSPIANLNSCLAISPGYGERRALSPRPAAASRPEPRRERPRARGFFEINEPRDSRLFARRRIPCDPRETRALVYNVNYTRG